MKKYLFGIIAVFTMSSLTSFAINMRYLLFFIFIANALHLSAQTIIKIENSLLEVSYTKHTVTDTLNRSSDYRDEGNLVLRIGKDSSSFFSRLDIWRDSLATYNIDAFMALPSEEIFINHPKEKEWLFKNWPTGKISVYNRFGSGHYTYTEDWQKPEWNLCDSTENILGYDCMMAECSFRGRRWIAFFAPEIPLSEGPWKLCGLPGLILKAYDSKSDYIFTATSMRTEGIPDVSFTDYWDYHWEETDRERYNYRRFKALHENLGVALAMNGMIDANVKAVNPGSVMPHRNYDFEETDYKH